MLQFRLSISVSTLMQMLILFHYDLCHDSQFAMRCFTIECFEYFVRSLVHPSLRELDTEVMLHTFHHMVKKVPLLGVHRGGLVQTEKAFACGFKFNNVLTEFVKVSNSPECLSAPSAYKKI